jgi:hypothetical protein
VLHSSSPRERRRVPSLLLSKPEGFNSQGNFGAKSLQGLRSNIAGRKQNLILGFFFVYSWQFTFELQKLESYNNLSGLYMALCVTEFCDKAIVYLFLYQVFETDDYF